MELLKNMLAAFGDYPKLTAILIIAVVLAVFVCIMAGRASSRMNKIRNAELEKIKEEVRLRKKFEYISESDVRNADCNELLKGLTSNIQIKLEKEADMKEAFLALPKEKQFVYALCFVYCEDADSLSSFFRLNGKPLTTAAKDAFCEIIGGDEAKLFERAYLMFDDDDETTSVTAEETEENDKKFENFDTDLIFGKILDYIANSAEIFNK